MKSKLKRQPTCKSAETEASEKKRGMSTASTCAFKTALFPLEIRKVLQKFVAKICRKVVQ